MTNISGLDFAIISTCTLSGLSFRTFTVVLAWVLVIVSFYEWPELLTGAQRLLQHAIESVGDEIPNPWGPRIEFVFREIGGLIWLQITLLVVGLWILLSLVAAIGRAISSPRRSIRGRDA